MRLPIIQDREIVPVRLIPIIANSSLGYLTLPGILANRLNIGGFDYSSDFDEIEVDVYDEETGCSERTTITKAELIGPQKRDNGVAAYHLNDDGKPVKMWASEWHVIYRDISILEPVLREVEKKNGVPQSMYSVWRLKATKILPPGVFLWRDDLDLLWQAHVSHYSPSSFESPDFRKGVNYDAYIRPEYLKLILEGFEHLVSTDVSSINEMVSSAQPALTVENTVTIGEAANILSTTTEEIFKLMFSAGEALLTPLIYLDEPKHMYRRESGTEITHEYLDGLFEIGGVRRLAWNRAGIARIAFGGSYGVLLERDQFTYYLSEGEEVYLNRADLRVAIEELKRLKQDVPHQTTPPVEPCTRGSNLPDRKGQKVPEDERRPMAAITQVLKSVIENCIENGNLEVVRPGNIDGFLKHLRTLIDSEVKLRDGVGTYANFIEEVKCGINGFVRMRYSKSRKGKTDKKSRQYPRAYITKRLSELRKEYSLFKDQLATNI